MSTFDWARFVLSRALLRGDGRWVYMYIYDAVSASGMECVSARYVTRLTRSSTNSYCLCLCVWEVVYSAISIHSALPSQAQRPIESTNNVYEVHTSEHQTKWSLHPNPNPPPPPPPLPPPPARTKPPSKPPSARTSLRLAQAAPLTPSARPYTPTPPSTPPSSAPSTTASRFPTLSTLGATSYAPPAPPPPTPRCTRT
jgi:hypothetical protein